jgi:PAS domain S-box-containing protein
MERRRGLPRAALALAACLAAGPAGSSSPTRFDHLGIENGLSQSSINAIVQDSRGFMWFGTEDGLNRYDGFNFRVFRHDPDDPGSLAFNHIKALCVDRSGALWAAMNGGGLDRYDSRLERFIHYRHNPTDPGSLSSDYVTSVAEDRAGNLWVGTAGGGLNRIDPARRRLTRYRNSPADPASLGHNGVRTVFEDGQGTLWVGTEGGLDAYDPTRDVFVHHGEGASGADRRIAGAVVALAEDRDGTLWVGTDDGLYAVDRSRSRVRGYRHDPRDPSSLCADDINALFTDGGGNLWIGTSSGLDERTPNGAGFLHPQSSSSDPEGIRDSAITFVYEDRTRLLWIGTRFGLDKLDRARKPFAHFRRVPGDPSSLSDNQVMMIGQDREGTVWIGTYTGGLNRFDPVRNTFTAFRHDPTDAASIASDLVMAFLNDRAGAYWVGTYAGLDRFDPVRGRFRRAAFGTEGDGPVGRDPVYALLEEPDGTLWIGTRNGLVEVRPDRTSFRRHRHDPGDPASLSNDVVFALLRDPAGAVWAGTLGGLNRFDRTTGAFVRYLHDPDDDSSLSHNEVQALTTDSADALWICTAGGLNRFEPAAGTFTHYRERDGLPNDLVYGALEDGQGRLWMSTNRGLSRFDPRTAVFRSFDVRDGLQSNEFNAGAFLKDLNGLLYFGGVNGFNVFDPRRIQDNPFPPEVVLTDLLISNRSVPIGPRGDRPALLAAAIAETTDLRLSQRERVISFEFSAMHFAAPEKNQYAYRMEGFDPEWNMVGNRRFATYTALPAGRYVFHVKASNNDGVWNETGVSLPVRVVPTFWGSRLFRILLALAVLILVAGVFKARTVVLRERARTLERSVEERTRDLRATNVRLEREIGERRRTEKALRESEDKYRTLAAQIPVGIYRTTLAGRYLYANPALAAMLGARTVDELLATPATSFYVDPQDRARKIAFWKAKGGTASVEHRLRTRKGRTIQVRDTGAVILNRRGEVEYISGVIEDISGQKRAEDRLKGALREKEFLLKEIHHRVKNNLQVISSLLRLQSRSTSDGPARELFLASQGRIRSMALVHESLYQARDLARIDFAAYIRKLTQQLVSLFKADPQRVKLRLRLERIPLDVNQAIPCGLIINELVSNALKHAFPGGRAGEVAVSLAAGARGMVRLTVRDNGVGLPAGLDIRRTPSLGLQIIVGLVDQLGGAIQMEGGAGTAAVIVFPLEAARTRLRTSPASARTSSRRPSGEGRRYS